MYSCKREKAVWDLARGPSSPRGAHEVRAHELRHLRLQGRDVCARRQRGHMGLQGRHLGRRGRGVRNRGRADGGRRRGADTWQADSPREGRSQRIRGQWGAVRGRGDAEGDDGGATGDGADQHTVHGDPSLGRHVCAHAQTSGISMVWPEAVIECDRSHLQRRERPVQPPWQARTGLEVRFELRARVAALRDG